ncbi:MAG: NifB/NifX family molybdenum-iron cluster-binding protein [Pseudomonadota bacterium]|nr:NifB/NifX family molybdenum-iron cluster-binding protein [Pseudomonadota bacterium]
MKIAVSSSGSTMDAQVDPRFGRCQYFIIYDSDSGSSEALANEFQGAGGGAGTQAAQMVASKGVNFMLTGNCGPNAFAVLQDAGVQVVTGASGTVGEAVKNFEQGSLQSSTGPNVADHAGMNTQSQGVVPPAPGMGGGAGMGGGGRGMGGGGRGMGGGGRGMGGGGRGMGGGRGGGRGGGGQRGNF